MTTAVAPRVPILPLWLITLALSVPLVTWLWSTEALREHLSHQVPAGQYLYLGSKLAGLYAVVLLWAQLVYGLLGFGARARLGIERGVAFHRQVGLTVWLLIALHGALFVTAVSVRTQHIAWQYVVPSAGDGYYRAMVSVGVCALMVLSASAAAALTRNRWPRRWRHVHRGMYLVAALAAWHSLSIGSESRMGAMPYLYGLMGMVLLAAFAWRWRSSSLDVTGDARGRLR